jgi:hypothetical protein
MWSVCIQRRGDYGMSQLRERKEEGADLGRCFGPPVLEGARDRGEDPRFLFGIRH